MYQSHASYRRCGLGSDGTDLLVDLARAAGVERGIYGAKITGGGSGGTVADPGERRRRRSRPTASPQSMLSARAASRTCSKGRRTAPRSPAPRPNLRTRLNPTEPDRNLT